MGKRSLKLHKLKQSKSRKKGVEEMKMEPVREQDKSVLNLHCSDSMSELPRRRALDEGKSSVGSLRSSLRRKRTQKLLKKDKGIMDLKELAAQDEYSSISSFIDKNGDAMTQQPTRVRRKLFEDDSLSVCSKVTSRSRLSIR